MTALAALPIWISGLLFLGLGTVAAMLGTVLVRRYVPLAELRTNNEVAGFKFATVGVLYAVLLAFAVLVVWEKLNDAESDVALEASAAVTIFRLASGTDAAMEPALREAITAYLNTAIAQDWPAMERGGESPEAVAALGAVYATLLRFEPADARGAAVLAEALRQLDLITQARRARIVVAAGIVPGVVWLLLFLGAFVTIGFTFFFGSANLKAQALMTGGLSLLIFSGLLIIITFDQPFGGAVKVPPEPLVRVLEDFGGATGE
jgi:hypothetical protein